METIENRRDKSSKEIVQTIGLDQIPRAELKGTEIFIILMRYSVPSAFKTCKNARWVSCDVNSGHSNISIKAVDCYIELDSDHHDRSMIITKHRGSGVRFPDAKIWNSFCGEKLG